MLKKIGIVLAVLVLGYVGYAQTRPSEYAVERSLKVAAPAEVIFPLMADYHRWPEWSPWDKLDPNEKREYAGPATGEGASIHWIGNDKVGEGRMTTTAQKGNELLDIKLEFIKPFPSTSQAGFTLKAASDGTTEVKWTMNGNVSAGQKLFTAFMDWDKMIGPDFEKGLASIKTIAEAEAKKRAEEAAAAAKKAAEEAAKKAAEEAAAKAAAAAAAPAAPVAK